MGGSDGRPGHGTAEDTRIGSGTSGDGAGRGGKGGGRDGPDGETRSEKDTRTEGKTGKRPEVGGPV